MAFDESVWSSRDRGGGEELIYPTAGPVAKGGSLALISRVAGWRLSVAVSVPSVFCRYLVEMGSTGRGAGCSYVWMMARRIRALWILDSQITGRGTSV